MIALIRNEILKIATRWRTAIGFGAIALLMPLVLWGFSKGGSGIERSMTHALQDQFIVVGSLFNGFLETYLVMNLLWVHIPFLVTLVAGDVVAAEGAAGTFRIYLTRAVSRNKILTSKLLATWIYTAALILFFAFMSLGLGALFLGTGDLIVMDNGILILPPEMAWTHFGLAFLLAIYSMSVIATLTFMFSSMVNNGIGPIIGTMAVLLVGLAISTLPIDWFDTIRPYLFSSYLDVWRYAFADPVPWAKIGKYAGILTLYMGGFAGIAYGVFNRRDMTT